MTDRKVEFDMTKFIVKMLIWCEKEGFKELPSQEELEEHYRKIGYDPREGILNDCRICQKD